MLSNTRTQIVAADGNHIHIKRAVYPALLSPSSICPPNASQTYAYLVRIIGMMWRLMMVAMATIASAGGAPSYSSPFSSRTL